MATDTICAHLLPLPLVRPDVLGIFLGRCFGYPWKMPKRFFRWGFPAAREEPTSLVLRRQTMQLGRGGGDTAVSVAAVRRTKRKVSRSDESCTPCSPVLC